MLFTCNHEADTKIVLNAVRSLKPLVITATDIGILILPTHLYPQCGKAK